MTAAARLFVIPTIDQRPPAITHIGCYTNWHRQSNRRAEQYWDYLGKTHLRQVEVAKLRLFLQMTFPKIAEVMSLSADTAESDWAFARAWLKREWGQSPENHTI